MPDAELKTRGVLVPLPARAAGAASSPAAGLWDGGATAAVVAPAAARASAQPALEGAGYGLSEPDVRLDARLDARGVAPSVRDALLAAPADVYRPTPLGALLQASALPGKAALAYEAWEKALAEASGPLRDLLRRAAREDDVLVVGDLLQTTAAPATPWVTLWVRHHAAGCLRKRLGALVALLRADDDDAAGGAGVTPLARVALGAAAWAAVRGGAPFDADVEAAVAGDALEGATPATPGDPRADTAASPAPPIPFEAPPVARALRESLERAARGEASSVVLAAPALHERLRDLARYAAASTPRDEGRACAARLGAQGATAGLDAGARLGLLLADERAGRPLDERRARLRRVVPGAAWDATFELFPELAGLDRLLTAIGAVPAAERGAAVERASRRLEELAREEPAFARPELERARAALSGLSGRVAPDVVDLLDLALAAAEGRTDLEERARKVVASFAQARDAARDEELGPAFDVLARAGATFASGGGAADRADRRGLELLCRFHAHPCAGAPPAELAARLLSRTPQGLALAAAARGLDPQAVALFLGAALPIDDALALAASLQTGPTEGASLLRVAPRARAGAAARGEWDAVWRGAPAVCWILTEDELGYERGRALVQGAGASLGGGETGSPRHPPAGLEVPLGAIEPGGLGLGRATWALVGPRVAGGPCWRDAATLAAAARRLAELHALGLVHGGDPLLSARRVSSGPESGDAGLRGLDPRASADAALREAGAEGDVARLRDAARSLGHGEPPAGDLSTLAAWAEEQARALERTAYAPLRDEVVVFFEDVLPDRPAVTPAEAHALLPAEVAGALDEDDVRDALRVLREEGWASGRFEVEVVREGGTGPTRHDAFHLRRPA